MLRSEKYLRLIAAVMFLAVGAYAAAFLRLKSENGTVTERAEYMSVSESFSVEGTAFRTLTPIFSDGGEYVLLAAEGDYLSGGSAVAVKKENADAYFAFCDGELAREKFFSEEDAVNAIKSGDAAHRALAALYLEGKKLPEKPAKPEGVIYAPCAGIFTRKIGECGAIASASCVYFSFESEKMPLLHIGQKLNLSIASFPQTRAEVFSIDEENNRAVLIIRNGFDGVPTDAELTAELSLSQCRGLRVPAEALHHDSDGNAYVNILSAGTEERKSVEILYSSRDFYLCDDGSLREGMQIIVSDGRKAG